MKSKKETQMKEKQDKTPTPAFEARLNHIRLTVWANQSNGAAWHNVVITRRYKDGDEWKESNSFSGLGDLALLGEAVHLAQEFVRSELLAGSAGQNPSDDN
jgi:hypothetical protein